MSGFEDKLQFRSGFGQSHWERDVNRHSYLLPSHSFVGASTRYGEYRLVKMTTMPMVAWLR